MNSKEQDMSNDFQDPFSATQDAPEQEDFPTSTDERDEYVQDPEDVPAGSAKEVLDWVDGDKDRAQRAYDAEQAKSEPRKGLSSELEDLLKN